MPTYAETLRARSHAVQTQTAELTSLLNDYTRDRRAGPPAGPESQSREHLRGWDRASARTVGPVVQRLSNSVDRLREHVELIRDTVAFRLLANAEGERQAAVMRNSAEYRRAGDLIAAAERALQTWRDMPAFAYDELNASWFTRERAALQRKTEDVPRVLGRGTREAALAVTGTTEQDAARTAKEEQAGRERGGETDWGTLILIVGSVATVIVGGGLILGLAQRPGVRAGVGKAARRAQSTGGKLVAHAKSLKERVRPAKE